MNSPSTLTLIKYEIGKYLPRFGAPTLVTVVEVAQETSVYFTEHYVFIPSLRKPVGNRVGLDYSILEDRKFYTPEKLMPDAQRQTRFFLEDAIYRHNKSAHRDFFFGPTPYCQTGQESEPFTDFKLHGNFVRDMERIAKSTKSAKLREVILEALKAPTLTQKRRAIL